jgi:hypothetical protein
MTLKHANYRDQPGFYADWVKSCGIILWSPSRPITAIAWTIGDGSQPLTGCRLGDFVMRELAGMDLDKAAIFAESVEGRDLFLVTNFAEFDRQPDVKEILSDTYPIYDQGEGYLIFDLRETQ